MRQHYFQAQLPLLIVVVSELDSNHTVQIAFESLNLIQSMQLLLK